MTELNVAALCYFAIPVIIVAIVNAIIAYRGMTKFNALTKNTWLPPRWIFSVVWIVLYILMAWGGYLYYTEEKDTTKQISFLNIFYVQLLLNFVWVLIFFGNPSLNSARFALMILLFLFVVVLYLAYLSWSVNQIAGWFFIVYAIWLVIAGALNIGVVLSN